MEERKHTTIQNDQHYQGMREEMTRLEALDWEDNDIDWEWVNYRLTQLKADIFAHDYAIELSYNPFEEHLS